MLSYNIIRKSIFSNCWHRWNALLYFLILAQISRLHLILKPFMLRRIKKDVENELTDKVEVLVYCPLTIRQKLLYVGLKRKIRIEELLQNLGSQSQINSSLNTSLMNLVMQFRKVSWTDLKFQIFNTKPRKEIHI